MAYTIFPQVLFHYMALAMPIVQVVLQHEEAP